MANLNRTKTSEPMKPTILILTFAWIAIIGLTFTILSDYFGPIMIAAVVFTLLVFTRRSRKDSTHL